MKQFITDSTILIDKLGINTTASTAKSSGIDITLNREPNQPLITISVKPKVSVFKNEFVVVVSYSLRVGSSCHYYAEAYSDLPELAQFCSRVGYQLDAARDKERESNRVYIQSLTK
jgi:hypothetical protein